MNTNKDILYKEESFAIIGACFNVYNDKGCGFLETIYNYLNATGLKLGLIINFEHHPGLEYERIVL